ncbi:hypothetical protein Lesp02_11250 [Lentzea sp. NBRC 105346]|uniref:ABC transporter permease n=1 Tax=Lentzea sp. NBRC 105346 TaxID=3032205 RepID=UPI0024A5D127|nr:ABC transporter permease [Lentzea sp. NBRC 105346]GLZ28935.1 hypothetical protein Lesp02_11250 [Lentzea sp. NBRC 105346]
MLSGKLRSAVIIGGQGIRARKLRTFLSMISLFMGVLAVVTVQAGAEIAERALLTDVELTQGIDGTRAMYIPDNGAAIVEDTVRGRKDAVAALNMSAIIGEPGVRPVNEGGMPFEYAGQGRGGPRGYKWCDQNGCYGAEETQAPKPDGQAIEVRLYALTGDVRTFRPFRPVSGQWLDFASAPAMAPRLVLNREAAKGLRQYHVPAEMQVTGASANMTPQITGVVDDGGMEPAAYVRIDELRTWLPSTAKQNGGQGGPGLQLLLSPGTSDLEQTLRARLVGLGIPADQVQAHEIDSRSRMSSQLSMMRWIFLGLAALVLLIGVAGILNVGLATVGERIEEFALRRAVGTSRMLLAGIVLSETLLTGLLTAGAAIGAGVVGLKIGSQIFGGRHPSLQGIEFPWQAGVAGVIAGLVAGILGGLIPAIRAARIPIATVMRA